jgi:tetratricopeptide (TPR) repeat protein
MDVSDIHLERALKESNATVNMLESNGDEQDLMEAYVNRGSILYMMGYFTSAMEDLTAASEMMEDMESNGQDVDAGTYVKAHATMGSILFEQNCEPAEEYGYAISRLSDLHPGSKHFDREGIIRLCVESAENLLDNQSPEDALEFVSKGASLLANAQDAWSRNRLLQFNTLMGECHLSMGDLRKAMDCYSTAIEIGTVLVDESCIEDMEELVVPIISRSQCEFDLGLEDMYLSDIELAIGLMEEMLKVNKLQDVEVLIHMHQDAASALMSMGKVEEAERHLMKAMTMGVNGAKDYIRDHSDQQF